MGRHVDTAARQGRRDIRATLGFVLLLLIGFGALGSLILR